MSSLRPSRCSATFGTGFFNQQGIMGQGLLQRAIVQLFFLLALGDRPYHSWRSLLANTPQ
jgi:hypothetical protein